MQSHLGLVMLSCKLLKKSTTLGVGYMMNYTDLLSPSHRDLVFGKFISTFTGFATGSITPAQYRSEVNKYTLYFIYLFVAKFGLVYIHSVGS
jgi:hypothetical protein